MAKSGGQLHAGIAEGARRQRRASWRARLLALALSLALSVGAAEIVVRLFFQEEIDPDAIHQANNAVLHIEGLAEPSPIPELFFSLKQDLLMGWGSVLVKTSAARRTRISTFSPPPANPALRIAVLGDSTPFGSGVHYDESYPALIRTMLEEKLGAPVEVRNFSTPMYNATSHRIVFESSVAGWKPDFIILHYDHNDSQSQVDKQSYGLLHPSYGENLLGSAAIKFFLRRSRAIRNKISFSWWEKRDKAEAAFCDGYRCGGPRFERHLRELRRLGAAIRRHKIPAVAVIYDWKLKRFDNPAEDPHHVGLHQELVPRLEEFGFAVLDMYPHYQEFMRATGFQDLSVFFRADGDHNHPNVLGHMLLAENLVSFAFGNDDFRPALTNAATATPAPELVERVAAVKKLQQGAAYLHKGDYLEAEKLFRKALVYRPNDLTARALLIQATGNLPKPEETLATLADLVELFPEYDWARMNLASYLVKANRLPESLPHLEHLILRTPSPVALEWTADMIVSVCRQQADLFAASGRLENAVGLLRGACNLLEARGLTEKTIPLKEALENHQQ